MSKPNPKYPDWTHLSSKYLYAHCSGWFFCVMLVAFDCWLKLFKYAINVYNILGLNYKTVTMFSNYAISLFFGYFNQFFHYHCLLLHLSARRGRQILTFHKTNNCHFWLHLLWYPCSQWNLVFFEKIFHDIIDKRLASQKHLFNWRDTKCDHKGDPNVRVVISASSIYLNIQ